MPTYLSALDLKQALDSVLVLTQQPDDSTVTCIRKIRDHPFHSRCQVSIAPEGIAIVITATGAASPAADLYHRNEIAISRHFDYDLLDQWSVEPR